MRDGDVSWPPVSMTNPVLWGHRLQRWRACTRGRLGEKELFSRLPCFALLTVCAEGSGQEQHGRGDKNVCSELLCWGTRLQGRTPQILDSTTSTRSAFALHGGRSVGHVVPSS